MAQKVNGKANGPKTSGRKTSQTTTVKSATLKRASSGGLAKREAATTTKTATATTVRQPSEAQLFGLPMTTWVGSTRKPKGAEARSGKRGFIFAFGLRDAKSLKKLASQHLNRWQLTMAVESEADVQFFQGSQGPVWFLRAPVPSTHVMEAALEKSGYARFRDLAGPVVNAIGNYGVERLLVETFGLTREEERGILVGLEMATYSYLETRGLSKKPRKKLPTLLFKSEHDTLDARGIASAAALGLSVNIARHLVNVPPNELNPKTYAEAIEELFGDSRTTQIEIYEGERLEKERMNLLLAVGRAAKEGPRLVHLRYRPEGVPSGVKPVAIVGKGITFDSGGVDIKPASGMRWMKKDMGGSAAVIALAKWAELTNLKQPLDFYVSLAENSVSGDAFRPGDVITARSGLTVEIQNTDAEGRLVLADALDLAATQEGDHAPMAIINVATLTGANKVALGAEIAGLYSNDDDLSTRILDAAVARGDLAWRMPLYQSYRSSLKSSFADCQNSADGFGGAITAALFLESFVKKIPFAHLDIYAWKDGAGGAWSEMGGSGQSVQGLSEVLARMEVVDVADALT